MNKVLFFVFVLLLAPAIANALDVTKLPEITDKEQVASAIEVNKVLNVITENIAVCTNNGQSYEKCLCENEYLIEQLAALMKEALSEYPQWLEMGWFEFKNEDDVSISFNVQGLKRQSEMVLNCETIKSK